MHYFSYLLAIFAVHPRFYYPPKKFVLQELLEHGIQCNIDEIVCAVLYVSAACCPPQNHSNKRKLVYISRWQNMVQNYKKYNFDKENNFLKIYIQ
jgi:hypothetical protein